MEGLSALSIDITKKLSKTEKKNDGIFFTPKAIVERTMKILEPHLSSKTTVLEPSCGSCEYIDALVKRHPGIAVTGIEKNRKIFEGIVAKASATTNLLHQDFLAYETERRYDLIVGNPPFYVMKNKDVPDEYRAYYEGRPNIFCLFVVKSLGLLTKGGILSFVLPRNFTNSCYYNKLRKHIIEEYEILDLQDVSDEKYIGTQQDTILFVVRNSEGGNNGSFALESGTCLNTRSNIVKLQGLSHGTTTLDEMGFKVSVGKVVWNQCKDILTEDMTKTRLVYSSDIVNNKLQLRKYANVEKKNFIEKKGTTDPVLVVNRGYGTGKYVFNHCIIDVKFEYLLENHIICITSKKPMEKRELLRAYGQITTSLDNPKTMEFIGMYFGNNSINTTELNYILPIITT